eukprot:4784169-Prymnesium_polylepis.1
MELPNVVEDWAESNQLSCGKTAAVVELKASVQHGLSELRNQTGASRENRGCTASSVEGGSAENARAIIVCLACLEHQIKIEYIDRRNPLVVRAGSIGGGI